MTDSLKHSVPFSKKNIVYSTFLIPTCIIKSFLFLYEMEWIFILNSQWVCFKVTVIVTDFVCLKVVRKVATVQQNVYHHKIVHVFQSYKESSDLIMING